jgi:hypothetical protein
MMNFKFEYFKLSVVTLSGALVVWGPENGSCSLPFQDGKEAISEETKATSTFESLILEKQQNFQQCNELTLQSSQTQSTAILLSLLLGGNSISKAELEEIKTQALLQEQQHLQRQTQIDTLTLRNEEIDKALPEALLDWFRQREQEHALTIAQGVDDFLSRCSQNVKILPMDDLSVKQTLVHVPDIIPNKAEKSFYMDYNSELNLWLGMELLQPTNVAWWQERLGWEATMQFGQYCKQDWISKSPWFTDSCHNRSIEEKLKQAFCPSFLDNSFAPTIRFESEYELMALRPTSIEKSPAAFQQAFQTYNPSENDRANYLAAFRGFKMNLDRYKMIPTWVAYFISEKVDGPVFTSLDPTSPHIKMAMTVTMGGPMYNPLGIFNSAIARASDKKPYVRLSSPFHIGVAKKVGEIDPEVIFGSTRPLENVIRIFQKINLPFSSSFKFDLSTNNLPIILREGNYYTQHDEQILFHCGRYTPLVLYDPQTDTTFQFGANHPFATNYYLGGIMARDMKFPFVTFYRATLANL